jgi:hypothetical protein
MLVTVTIVTTYSRHRTTHRDDDKMSKYHCALLRSQLAEVLLPIFTLATEWPLRFKYWICSGILFRTRWLSTIFAYSFICLMPVSCWLCKSFPQGNMMESCFQETDICTSTWIGGSSKLWTSRWGFWHRHHRWGATTEKNSQHQCN